MLKNILKAFSYYKAPKKTFAALHPVKFIGLSALALPLSLWLGKKAKDRYVSRSHEE